MEHLHHHVCGMVKSGAGHQVAVEAWLTFQFDAISVRQIQDVVADLAPDGHLFALGRHVRNVDTGRWRQEIDTLERRWPRWAKVRTRCFLNDETKWTFERPLSMEGKEVWKEGKQAEREGEEQRE